ncbi:MAG: sulfatase-like hydrolase/transferase [Planctomycetes bacterium]|nr:sulfatase-like hydrolase/transferase [Planctomycetota bacterium]
MAKETPTRREFLRVAGAATAGLTLASLARASAQALQRPNILFIMSDDHAFQAIGCYGSRINASPNLDRLAREGVLFHNCFCTNSICAPSRAAILTGKYGHKNGIIDNETQFDNTQTTFPPLLQRAGYQTAMFGKWHLKSDPVGFDYWNILPDQGSYYNPDFIEMGKRHRREGYVTDLITDDCLAWLRKRNSKRPFCVLLQNRAPHRAAELRRAAIVLTPGLVEVFEERAAIMEYDADLSREDAETAAAADIATTCVSSRTA